MHPIKTQVLTRRLVSLDGGDSYVDLTRISDEVLARTREQLFAAMDPAVRERVDPEGTAGKSSLTSAREILANYLLNASSHLVIARRVR